MLFRSGENLKKSLITKTQEMVGLHTSLSGECLATSIRWHLSIGFSRQEYWSGVPLPSPVCSILKKNIFRLLCCKVPAPQRPLEPLPLLGLIRLKRTPRDMFAHALLLPVGGEWGRPQGPAPRKGVLGRSFLSWGRSPGFYKSRGARDHFPLVEI